MVYCDGPLNIRPMELTPSLMRVQKLGPAGKGAATEGGAEVDDADGALTDGEAADAPVPPITTPLKYATQTPTTIAMMMTVEMISTWRLRVSLIA